MSLRIASLLRHIGCAASPALLLALALCPKAQAKETQPVCPSSQGHPALHPVTHTLPPGISEASRKLIVIGFMGGHVRANNLVHKEAFLAKDLQQHDPLSVQAAVFANRDARSALDAVLHLLDENRDGCLTVEEKNGAHIVIFGHSWGASETVTLARRLNDLHIPVLLTIQVDSIQKSGEDDGRIPPNVREAVNFYQSEGLLHGRSSIRAMDPKQTIILGNFKSTYKSHPVSCARYPWYARAFMKPHIEIENDSSLWNRIETLIQTKFLSPSSIQSIH